MLCVLILYMSDGTYILKSTPTTVFFEKVIIAIFFTLRVFARKEKVTHEIFFFYIFILMSDLGFELWHYV